MNLLIASGNNRKSCMKAPGSERVKGQMNQKIDIFSFVALPSPNTKKNHPKLDLGKDFSSQAFIER